MGSSFFDVISHIGKVSCSYLCSIATRMEGHSAGAILMQCPLLEVQDLCAPATVAGRAYGCCHFH